MFVIDCITVFVFFVRYKTRNSTLYKSTVAKFTYHTFKVIDTRNTKIRHVLMEDTKGSNILADTLLKSDLRHMFSILISIINI